MPKRLAAATSLLALLALTGCSDEMDASAAPSPSIFAGEREPETAPSSDPADLGGADESAYGAAVAYIATCTDDSVTYWDYDGGVIGKASFNFDEPLDLEPRQAPNTMSNLLQLRGCSRYQFTSDGMYALALHSVDGVQSAEASFFHFVSGTFEAADGEANESDFLAGDSQKLATVQLSPNGEVWGAVAGSDGQLETVINPDGTEYDVPMRDDGEVMSLYWLPDAESPSIVYVKDIDVSIRASELEDDRFGSPTTVDEKDLWRDISIPETKYSVDGFQISQDGETVALIAGVSDDEASIVFIGEIEDGAVVPSTIQQVALVDPGSELVAVVPE